MASGRRAGDRGRGGASAPTALDRKLAESMVSTVPPPSPSESIELVILPHHAVYDGRGGFAELIGLSSGNAGSIARTVFPWVHRASYISAVRHDNLRGPWGARGQYL